MTLGSGWAAEVQAKVRADGTVHVMGKTYWRPAMAKYIDWDVTVRVPERGGAPAQVWAGHHYLCSPYLIADAGFSDIDGARATAARLRELRRPDRRGGYSMSNQASLESEATNSLLYEVNEIGRSNKVRRAELTPEYERRRGLVIRRQAEILLELIDQRIELQRVVQRSFSARLFGKASGYLRDFVKRVRPAAAQHLQHRDLKIAQEPDLALKLAEAVFLHSFVDLSVHGFGFHQIAFEEMEDRIPIPDAGHRLSGGAK